MADYKSMYTVLCKTVDGVVDNLEKIPLAKKETESLKKALLFAEEIYINTSLHKETDNMVNIKEIKK